MLILGGSGGGIGTNSDMENIRFQFPVLGTSLDDEAAAKQRQRSSEEQPRRTIMTGNKFGGTVAATKWGNPRP